MSVVANIAINVDSTKAVSQLQAVDRAATGLSGNTGKLQEAFGGLNTALAGLGLGVLIKDLTGVGLDADRTGKRIQSLAGASGETSKVLAIASKAAKDFGLSNLEAEKGVADLYGRLRPAGVALKDIETVYNGVNKAALAAGLTNADTSGVFLQLSQALGSGALQGDELRSIMEQMPAVGQAVAKVMGVTVGEVKKLGSDGKITTDVMIKAAAELNKLAPPPPDPFKVFNAELQNLRVELGENILPILTPFVQLLLGVVKAFSAIPEPLQTVIVALGLIATAILAIGAAVAFLAPVIAGFKTFALVVGGLNIGGLIAGWLPVVVASMSGITAALSGLLAFITGTLIPGLIAIFSGPVGWTILAVAAVVAMAIAFREPIMQFFGWLGGAISTAFSGLMGLLQPIFVQPFIDLWDNVLRRPVTGMLGWIGGYIRASMKTALALAELVFVKPWVNLWNVVLRKPVTTMIGWLQTTWKGITKFFSDNVTTPISKAWTALNQLLPDAMKKTGEFVQSVWTGIINNIKNVFRGMLNFIVSGINTAVDAINYLIRGYNSIPLVGDIPTLGRLSVPSFAEGGIVDRPTLAVVGEGGEREYIIPESKMAATAANYLSSAGSNAVTAGSGGGNGSGGAPSINITTGPVLQMDGEQYVTIYDLERAMQMTADGVYKSLRTSAGRYAVGTR
jgi:tape measure domain-containing protein